MDGKDEPRSRSRSALRCPLVQPPPRVIRLPEIAIVPKPRCCRSLPVLAENPIPRLAGRYVTGGNRGFSRIISTLRSGIAVRDSRSRRIRRIGGPTEGWRDVPEAAQVVQALPCRRGCSMRSFTGAWRFRRLCARIDDEGPRPLVRRRRARARAAQRLFRPGSPSQAISDCGAVIVLQVTCDLPAQRAFIHNNGVLLPAIDPAGQDQEQQLPWLKLCLHVPPDAR